MQSNALISGNRRMMYFGAVVGVRYIQMSDEFKSRCGISVSFKLLLSHVNMHSFSTAHGNILVNNVPLEMSEFLAYVHNSIF